MGQILPLKQRLRSGLGLPERSGAVGETHANTGSGLGPDHSMIYSNDEAIPEDRAEVVLPKSGWAYRFRDGAPVFVRLPEP